MCQNWSSQLSNLLKTELPAVDAVMVAANVPASIQAEINAAYAAADLNVVNFSGTDTLATVDSALNEVLAVTESLQGIIPQPYGALIPVIIVAIEGGIALFRANTAPTPEKKSIVDHAVESVQAKRPGLKLSHVDVLRAHFDDHVMAGKFKDEFNKDVDALGPEYAHLKQA